jgi:hypothetical protein
VKWWRWLWAVLALALALAGGVGILGYPQWQLARARHDVNELVLGLNAYRIKFGHPIEGTTAEVCAVLRGEDVRGQNPEHEAVVDSYKVNAAGEFLDPWGLPYRIIVGAVPRVYSCGPNRIDEQGGGDDIAR